jgi:hypothetical protein
LLLWKKKIVIVDCNEMGLHIFGNCYFFDIFLCSCVMSQLHCFICMMF